MRDISLKPYDEKYEKEVLTLYSTVFENIFLRELGRKKDELIEEGLKNTVLALKKEKLIGFGSLVQLGESPMDKESLERNLYWARHKEREDYLKDYYQEYCNEIKKGKVVIGYFENKFINKNKEILEKDIYFSHLVVHPNFRRQGIGKLLAEKRISISKEKGAKSIYLNALEKSGSEELYSKLGFDSIIRSGPVHPSGHSSLLMGLELE